MSFIHLLFLNCRFHNKFRFPCACNCTSFVWKCDRHFAIYSAPSLEIEFLAGFPRGVESIEKSVDFQNRFSRPWKVLNWPKCILSI